MADRQPNQLDSIFVAIGDLKKFTVLQFIVLTATVLPMSYQLLSHVFICRDVPYRCAEPQNASDVIADLGDEADNLTISYERCHIVVSSSDNNTVLKREACKYGIHYDLPRDISVISQFDLVCDYSSLGSLSQTLVIAGQGLGALLSSMVSDRFGRKPVIVASNLGLLATSLGSAFAPNYTTYAISRFFVGAFQQAIVAVVSTLTLEMLTTSKRGISPCLHGFRWSLVAISLALWCYLLRNYSWRTQQLALSLTSTIGLLLFCFVEESLRWLIANAKYQQALSYLQRATKTNQTNYQHALQVYNEICQDPGETLMQKGNSLKASSGKLTLLDLWKVKRFLLYAIVMWFTWFTTALSFFAIYLTSTSLAGNRFLNFFLVALMEIPTTLYLVISMKKTGRKPSLIGTFAAVSVGLLASGLFRSLEPNTQNSTFALVFTLLAMIGASASFTLVFFYTQELFPTNMRSQALGVSTLMGRAGGMIAPFTGVLSTQAEWAPGLLIGACAGLVCLLLSFLPETRGRDLPQTLEDLDTWQTTKKEEKEMTGMVI